MVSDVIAIGKRGKLLYAVKARCCDPIIPEGTEILVSGRTSQQLGKPRIVFVTCENGPYANTIHKVKLSKIKMVTP